MLKTKIDIMEDQAKRSEELLKYSKNDELK